MSIRQSDTAYPQGVNQRRDWPTHTRDWKQEVFDVFKNCTGEVTSTDEELTFCDGLIQDIKDSRLLSSTSSGASYVITPSPAYTSLSDGYRFCVQADQANLANPTITVNSIAAKSLVHSNGASIDADFIPANAIFKIIFDESEDHFQLLSL